MGWEQSNRLAALPPYLFVEIDRAKREAIAAGKDVINLGVGDPDRPTFDFIVEAMSLAIREPANQCYPFDEGVPQFRTAAADFMKARYGVELDSASEIITTIGSKDGIAHLPLAVVNPGDVVLVPQPGYPVYNSAAIFAGGEPVYLPLTEDNSYLPDLDAIDAETAARTKMIYVNYPNNPTTAVADLDWYTKLVAWAKANEIIIASDTAYNEMYFEIAPPSIFQVPGAIDVAVEFHSLSKTFNMTGWRIGFVAGNADIIAALAKIKGNVDSGQFNAVQWAGVAALENYAHPDVVGQRQLYAARRDVLCAGLSKIGFDVNVPAATFYVWTKCPPGVDSMTFAKRSLADANVNTIPGVGFGAPGDGYFRMALTADVDRLEEAVDRLSKISW